MLEPLRTNANRRQLSKVKYVDPPTNGWNARDSLTAMKTTDAVVMDNMIQSELGTTTRKGHAEHATGMTNPVLALMEYAPEDGVNKLFAATSDSIFDASSAAAVGAADVTGLTNGNWNATMFATTGGQFLVGVNGADGVRTYDGTTWATQVITGATAADFAAVLPHHNRLWFIEKDSLNVHYLPVQSIAGAASTLKLGSYSKLGGKLMAMASWSRDGGSGPDDLAVFITSKGQVHIYSGDDPDTSGQFNRVGTFKIAPPIGRRCIINAGADVGILTTQGVIPLSSVLPLALGGQKRKAATDRIGKAFKTTSAARVTDVGWEVVELPSEQLVIVNVPTTSRTVQYVMYSATDGGKWSRFTGLKAHCWAEFNNEVYFGADGGKVMKYTGDSDDGEAINWLLVCAFNNFRSMSEKTFKRIRPQFVGPPGYEPRLGLRIDFDEQELTFNATAWESTGAKWDEAIWDTAEWAVDRAANGIWQSVEGKGFSAAVIISGATEQRITFNGAKILYEEGDGV